MSIKSHRGSGPMEYDDTKFPKKSHRSRKSKLPSRFSSDSVMPKKYKSLYDNINRSSIPDEVKNDVIEMVEEGECKVDVVNDYVEKRSDEKEFNMDDLNDAIEKLGLSGGGVLKTLVEQDEHEEADISTAVAEVIRGLKETPRVESQIALPQVPKSQILMGYVNAIYAKVNTTLDECMRLLWTKDLQAALVSYVAGKIALITISNPGNIASFINTLTTTIAPYASAGTGILSTVALGTIIKKVFGHYATTTAIKAGESKYAIVELNTKVNEMEDEDVAKELMTQGSALSTAANKLFQSLKDNRPTDYNALARILPEIDANLDIEDSPSTGDVIVGERKRRKTTNDTSTGATFFAPSAAGDSTAATIFKAPPAAGDSTADNAMDIEGDDAAGDSTATGKRKAEEISTTTEGGKRKSKKRQTKNKKNKARKTKKNKRSSKKKVHKKK